MSKRKKEKGRTLYAKMLGNIASDLDSLLTDLHGKKPANQPVAANAETDKESGHLSLYPPGTLHSADTLGKDSFFSSAGNTSGHHPGGLSSTTSLLSGGEDAVGTGARSGSDIDISNIATDGGLHSRSGEGQQEVDLESSVDSGHGGTGKSRSCSRAGAARETAQRAERSGASGGSPLVFDPQHFSRNSPIPVASNGSSRCGGLRVVLDVSPSTDEFRPISTVERLVKTNSIWLLASLSRAGAVHILKDRDTGNFIVRKSSQPNSLAMSVQSRLCGHPAVDHYLIQGTPEGFRLEGSAHLFHSIPTLIAYYIENIDEIPYHLRLPVAIQQARSTRELASLDMLGQDFWSSTLSRKSPSPNPSFIGGQLHKSQSEPINIQRQPSLPHTSSQQQLVNNTPPSRSTEGFSHFMHTQVEMERYFAQRIKDVSLTPDTPQSEDHQSRAMGSADSFPSSAGVFPVPGSSSGGVHSAPASTPLRVLPALPTEHDACSHPQFTSVSDKLSQAAKHVSSLDGLQPGDDQEPIYSVSKKQKKKSIQPVGDKTDSSHVDIQTIPGSAAGTATPHLSPSSSHKPPVSVTSSLPIVHHSREDEDPYRCSPSNQPVGAVFTTSASWDHNLSEGHTHGACSQTKAGGNSFVPRPKANLYFTTNLDLLEIPDNTYFMSNLSDRLSDYEDIWRSSSCAESDLDPKHRHGKQHSRHYQQQQQQHTAARMIVDPRGVFDARISQQQGEQQKQPSPPSGKDMMLEKGIVETELAGAPKEGRRKVLRKTSRDWPAARRLPVERDAVTGGTTGLTALEQARRIAGSTSDEDNAVSPTAFYQHHHPPPIAHVKGIRRLSSVFDDEYGEQGQSGEVDEQRCQNSITTSTSKTIAVSKTTVMTNTNSIHILPSRPNQIKFVTSHSLDFSPNSPASLPSQQHQSSALIASSAAAALTPTPTSSKSLPAQIVRDAQTCVFTTTMAVHVSESSDQPASPRAMTTSTSVIQPATGTRSESSTKNKASSKKREKLNLLSPLSRLSRLKSSSESSLATVSSPLYAEPADAVKLRDKHGKAINIQVRRQSAPSGPQQLLAAAREKQRHQQHQTCNRVSQNPNLDTIFSPKVECTNAHTSGGGTSKFSFEDVHQSCSASSSATTIGSSSGPILARSHSMRTPYEQTQLQRKQSWRDRLNRLKLGTRVLTRNLTPPSAPSARKHQHQLQTEAYGSDLISENMDHGPLQSKAQVPPSPSSPGKFPVLNNHFFQVRDSCFSESSTVQDLICCAHPELSVRPIVAGPKSHLLSKVGDLNGAVASGQVPAAPSEYDNLGIYRTSSIGTVYSPPWETSAASRLMRESPQPAQPASQQAVDANEHPWLTCVHPPPLPSQPPMQQLSSTSLSHAAQQLPPAMDFQERIAHWHKSNTSYLRQHEVIPSTSVSSGDRDGVRGAVPARAAPAASAVSRFIAGTGGRTGSLDPHPFSHEKQSLKQPSPPQTSHHERYLQEQQQQLLHHQRQLKNNDTHSHKHQGQDALQRQMSSTSSTHHQQQPLSNHIPISSDPGHPLPPLSPVSPVMSSLANSVTLPTAIAMSNPVPRTSSPAPFSSSATTTSPHRLSSHCPDVVHCHSTPVPPTSTSQSFQTRGDVSNTDVSFPQLIGEDDVLFGGSLTMASPELQRQISPILSHQNSIGHTDLAPGTRIREYLFKLSNDRQTIFGSTIENFIQCTLESQETNPQHVMRNVRQFMTGIKNYLVKHGEGMLEDLIERERNKLGSNEILNIDAIIEQALHVCVLKPLKYHIYHLFVEKYNANHALEQLSRNIKYARTKTAEDLGVKSGLSVPENTDMDVIKHYLDLMQRSYSPLQKLQNLLKATSTIYHCVQGKHQQFPSRGPSSLGADDFLPMLIYVLVHCGLVAAEIEADFMWGLLQPSLLTGEGGYYLTTLSSAVLVLKNFQETHDLAPAQHEGHLPALSDMQGFLKIAILDELHDSINWKTLPVRPNMNTRDVCALVAHKFKVTNPQDYGLFLLCEGHESQLAEGDCPQIIKGDYVTSKRSCFFAFKRLDANIAWPKHMQESTVSSTDMT